MQALQRLNTPMGKRLTIGARWIVAVALAFAAVPKLADPGAFVQSIDNYHVLPAAISPWIALMVPVLELVTAVALATGALGRGGGILAAGLLAVFTAVIAQAMARGIDVECGCFGSSVQARADWLAVARNIALLGAAVVAVLGPPHGLGAALGRSWLTPHGE